MPLDERSADAAVSISADAVADAARTTISGYRYAMQRGLWSTISGRRS